MESVQVGKVNIHSVKDTIQNDVMEEASTSHADNTAPPNASSTLQISKVEKHLRNQRIDQQIQQARSANTSKNESSITPNTTVMSFQQQQNIPVTTWLDSSLEDKTNLSNSITTQKESVITDSLVQNLPTNVSSTTSTTHDINMMTPNMKTLNAAGQYTPDSTNFSTPSTPLDSSPSGTFNQFSLNTDKTTGQQNNPNAAKSKPFVCSVCNQTFSRQHNLKSHALTHSQEKPFQCDICHHFFRRHHDLKRHAKLHTGEKPYQCPHCKRKFARLDALNRHLRAESFCGGPQKKLFQNSESKLEQTSQQPLLQPPPQQSVPQSIQTSQSQPQTKLQLDQKQNSQATQLQQQQYKQPVEDLQKKQVQNQTNNNTVNKNEISFQRQQVMHQEQYSWPQQMSTQQLSQIQSIPQPNNTPSLQGKQATHANIVMTNQSHQLVFPVETTTASNPVASHYKIQYTLNKQIPEPQRRVSEIIMTNDQDVEVHSNSSKSSQLIERNSYLEERVRELENEVINERKLRSRREYLEQRVNELEIEKNLLKQLLLERDTSSSDISHLEKKRKTSSPIDSSKHQKD